MRNGRNRAKKGLHQMRKGLACLIFGVLALPAAASIVHQPHFKVDGMVIVWGGNSGEVTEHAPKARLGKSVVTTLKAPVVTGILLPAASTEAPETRFPMATETASQSYFYVASNTAFSIDANLANSGFFTSDTLSQTSLSLSASLQSPENPEIGRKAQYPHSAGPGGGLIAETFKLSELTRRTTIFRGNQRTAARRGSIAEQSVRFDLNYTNQDPSVSHPLPDMVFTVFVP